MFDKQKISWNAKKEIISPTPPPPPTFTKESIKGGDRCRCRYWNIEQKHLEKGKEAEVCFIPHSTNHSHQELAPVMLFYGYIYSMLVSFPI